jgi:hypothetical protein
VNFTHRNDLLANSSALPIFCVAIRESYLAGAGIDALDTGLAAAVEGSLDYGAVGELDAIGFESDWKTIVIDEFNLDPRCFGGRDDYGLVGFLGGRTCRTG